MQQSKALAILKSGRNAFLSGILAGDNNDKN